MRGEDLLKQTCLQVSGLPLEVNEIFSVQKELEWSALFQISSIQEPSLFIARRRAFILSGLILDEKGGVDKARLQEWIGKLPCLFSPYTQDPLFFHFMTVLQELLNNQRLVRSLNRFLLPVCHSFAEELIRFSVYKKQKEMLDNRDLRRAVLSALLTPLRQSVGSCFATAPAILIQKDQCEQFLQDLYDLLFSSKLQRTFGGVQYAVPMSFSTGVSDLGKQVGRAGLLCPSFSFALETVGIKPVKQKENMTVEELLESSVLSFCSLTKQDVAKAEQQERKEAMQFHRGMLPFSSTKALNQLDKYRKMRNEVLETFKAVVEHPLLKIWEFTLASFSEMKMEFSKWNFYVSLGFAHEEKGGIGELLLKELQTLVDQANQQIQQSQREYELAFDQVRGVETLMRNAGSEAEARRLQAEYQSVAYHMRACLEKRDAWHEKGEHLSQLFSFLLQEYSKRFADYFQEIYDPNMQDVRGGIYEDRPAGFRLVYKHGRQNPHLWTVIHDQEEYLNALCDFFILTEPQLSSFCPWEGGQEAIGYLTAKILHHVRDPLFVKTALARMAKAYSSFFQDKKPWSYTSGGTMVTLLKTYFAKEKELTKEEKWVASPMELLTFILDTLKNLPPHITDLYLKKKKTGMLMQSPTHAFVLLPETIKKGWQGNEFTYTWVRDLVLIPSQQFYRKRQLGKEEIQFLCNQLQIPSLNAPLSIAEFGKCLIDLGKDKDEVASFLFENFPLVPLELLEKNLGLFLSELGISSFVVPDIQEPFIPASSFHALVKSLYLKHVKQLDIPFDLHAQVATIAKKIGTMPPSSFLFADTNWPQFYFAFLVNPLTEELDLWRVSYSFEKGIPMSDWRKWMSGQDKKTWCIYVDPKEYSFT